MGWPRIVAESLREIDRPALSASGAVPACPDESSEPTATDCGDRRPPPFLYQQQHDAWRRVMRALNAWHGALLLEPVGTGKTWIALGVAACEPQPALAIVPSIVQAQWHRAAMRAGLTLGVWTHERASRGALPEASPTLVIIDEAHRFRNTGTRRVQNLAPWIAGRRVLLLTATPIVNRLADLVTLLRLAVPENALALDGIPRLADVELMKGPPAALRRVAIRSSAGTITRVPRHAAAIVPDDLENRRGARAVAAVRTLTLSRVMPIRRLLVSVFLDAAASSDAAFHRALLRYRALLLQSQDAGGASRSMLRQFAGDNLEQTVLWPLFDVGAEDCDLAMDDIARIDGILATTPDDARWIARVVAHCGANRPTICFSRHRATAARLRSALGDTTAWLTGTEAGVGPHRVQRQVVLDAFGANRYAWQARRAVPSVLVATDVAAEGLDLHAAGRVIHVDLPWTATRVEQREGRLARLGQAFDQVEVIVRLPAQAIERALAPHARVRHKHRLAETWLHGLEGGIEPDARRGCPLVTTLVDGGRPAALVKVRLERGTQSGVMTLVRCEDTDWQCNRELAEQVHERSLMAQSTGDGLAPVGSLVAEGVRAAISAAMDTGQEAAPSLVARVHRLARRAASERDADAMRRLDRLLRFVTASPTQGARMIMTGLAACSDRAFLDARIPDVHPAGAIGAQLVQAIVVSWNT